MKSPINRGRLISELAKSDNSGSLEDIPMPRDNYVGYKSESLMVTNETVWGSLRKLVQDV